VIRIRGLAWSECSDEGGEGCEYRLWPKQSMRERPNDFARPM
jgi:hypothetical protein